MSGRFLGGVLGTWLSLVVFSGCANDAAACASCPTAGLLSEWCDVCDTGTVATLRVESRMLFDALDAHGHDLDPDRISCATCRELMVSGGFCTACRFGWVDGQAYMSRLTYQLALGEVRDPASVACVGCREQASPVGWCALCGGGWAGNVYFEDRAAHDQGVAGFELLQAAIAASERCETCSLVLLVDGRCPYCNTAYKDGRPVPGDRG